MCDNSVMAENYRHLRIQLSTYHMHNSLAHSLRALILKNASLPTQSVVMTISAQCTPYTLCDEMNTVGNL